MDFPDELFHLARTNCVTAVIDTSLFSSQTMMKTVILNRRRQQTLILFYFENPFVGIQW